MAVLPLIFLMIVPMAAGAIYVAPKLGRSPWVWGILFLIPGINFVAMFLFYFFIGADLERIKAARRRQT